MEVDGVRDLNSQQSVGLLFGIFLPKIDGNTIFWAEYVMLGYILAPKSMVAIFVIFWDHLH